MASVGDDIAIDPVQRAIERMRAIYRNWTRETTVAQIRSDWDAAFVNSGALSWIASQASKPGRPSSHAWLLHASTEWSRAHLEDGRERVAKSLLAEAKRLRGVGAVNAKSVRVHRWRHALANEPLETGAFCFEERRLAIAGDWCAGSRVEGAFLSGLEAGERIAELQGR